MDYTRNIERFEGLISEINRDGKDALLQYIKSSDFYTAPSSSRFHLSVTGGLLQHSLNVFDALIGLLSDNGDGTYSYKVAGKEAERVTRENVIIMALLHDMCKTGFYNEITKWRKDERNNWEQYSAFEIEDRHPYGHGEKSVMMIESYMRLTPEERYAIRWHMGFPEGNDKYTFTEAVDMYPVIWALHTADMMAAHVMEDKEGNRENY